MGLSPQLLLVHLCSFVSTFLALFRSGFSPGEETVMQVSSTGSASAAHSNTHQITDPPSREINTFVVSFHHHIMLVGSALTMLL